MAMTSWAAAIFPLVYILATLAMLQLGGETLRMIACFMGGLGLGVIVAIERMHKAYKGTDMHSSDVFDAIWKMVIKGKRFTD